MSDFTLYEADSDNLAIAWGPMSLEKAIIEATNLVAESTEENWNGIMQDLINGMSDMNEDGMKMAWICKWLNLRRKEGFTNADGSPLTEPAYRYYYTDERPLEESE